MEKKLVIYFFIAFFILVSINLISTKFLIYEIEKHSIHPVYGIYQQKIFGCQPWDACHHKDKEQNQ